MGNRRLVIHSQEIAFTSSQKAAQTVQAKQSLKTLLEVLLSTGGWGKGGKDGRMDAGIAS